MNGEKHAAAMTALNELNPTIFVYVAGPFSARTRGGVEINIKRAVEIGLEVAKLGFMPVIPHANTAHPEFELIQPYTFWIDGTTEFLRRCDAMIMVPDKKVLVYGEPPEHMRHIVMTRSMEEVLNEANRIGAVEVERAVDSDQTQIWARLGSWRDSSGTLRERAEAARLGIPIFDTVYELSQWSPTHRGTFEYASCVERDLIVGKLYREAREYEKNGMQDRAETLRWHAAAIENLDHRKPKEAHDEGKG